MEFISCVVVILKRLAGKISLRFASHSVANPDLELIGRGGGGGWGGGCFACPAGFLPFAICSVLPKIRGRRGGGGGPIS